MIKPVLGDVSGMEKNYGQLVLPSCSDFAHFLNYSMLLLNILLIINKLLTYYWSDPTLQIYQYLYERCKYIHELQMLMKLAHSDVRKQVEKCTLHLK